MSDVIHKSLTLVVVTKECDETIVCIKKAMKNYVTRVAQSLVLCIHKETL